MENSASPAAVLITTPVANSAATISDRARNQRNVTTMPSIPVAYTRNRTTTMSTEILSVIYVSVGPERLELLCVRQPRRNLAWTLKNEFVAAHATTAGDETLQYKPSRGTKIKHPLRGGDFE